MPRGISFGGDEIYSSITIDGQDVKEVTMDGQIVWPPFYVIEDWEGFGNQVQLPAGAWSHNGTAEAVTRYVASADGSGKGISIESGGQGTIWSNGGDGLEHYPGGGMRFETWWYCEGQDAPEFWFCTTGGMPNGRYQLEYFWDGNFQMRRYESGNEVREVKSNNNPINLNTDTWYKFVVDLDNPERTFNWYAEIQDSNENKVSGAHIAINDSVHRNPAIGYQGNPNNGRVFFDQAKITQLF